MENGPLLTTDVKHAKDKTILSLLVSIKIETKCKSNLEDNINMLSNSKWQGYASFFEIKNRYSYVQNEFKSKNTI